MQIVENWAEVRGRVEAVRREPDADRVRLDVRVLEAEPVEGFPNLLSGAVGEVIPVDGAPGDALREVREGDVVRGRVRKAGGARFFLLPDSARVEPPAP